MTKLRRSTLMVLTAIAATFGLILPAAGLTLLPGLSLPSIDLGILKLEKKPVVVSVPNVVNVQAELPLPKIVLPTLAPIEPLPVPLPQEIDVPSVPHLLGPVGESVADVLDTTKEVLVGLLPPPLDQLTFSWRTTYQPPSGPAIVKTTPGVIGAPMALNTDEQVGDELSATLTVTPEGEILVDVARTLVAPDTLPVEVVAVVNDKGVGSQVVEAGYDARQSTAPGQWTGTVGIDGSNGVALTVDTFVPGPSLTTVARTFKRGSGGPVDPTSFSVKTTPVPASLTMTAGLQGSSGAGLQFASTSPTKLVLGVDANSGVDRTTLDLTVDKLPRSASLGVDGNALLWSGSAVVDQLQLDLAQRKSGVLQQSLSVGIDELQKELSLAFDASGTGSGLEWTASGVTAGLDIALRAPASSDRVKRADVALRDIPKRLVFGVDPDTGAVGISAPDGGRLGSLDLRIDDGTTQSGDQLADGHDGLVLVDRPTHFALTIRLTGLYELTATTGTPPTLLIDIDSGRVFDVRFDTSDANLTATIDKIQRHTTFTFDGSETPGLTWTADGRTDKVDLAVSNSDGSSITLALRDVPTKVTFGLDPSSGSVGIIAGDDGDDVLGSLELRIDDGHAVTAYEGLAADRDGVVLVNTPARSFALVRLTAVRKVAVDAADPQAPRLEIDENEPRTFVTRVASSEGGPVSVLNIVIDTLERHTAFTFANGSGTLTLGADERIDHLSLFLTNGTDASIQFDLQDLPTLLELGLSATGQTGLVTNDAADLDEDGDSDGPGVGLLRATITSRVLDWANPPTPGASVPGNPELVDGVNVSDQSNSAIANAARRHSTLGLRAHGLRAVLVGTGANEPLEIDSTGGRTFRLNFTGYSAGKNAGFTSAETFPENFTFPNQEFARITIEKLQPHTQVAIGANGALVYRADNATQSLRFEANGGDQWMTSAQVGGGSPALPLPQTFSICVAGNVSCSNSPQTIPAEFKAAGGSPSYSDEAVADQSMAIVASEQTRLNFLACSKPVTTNCHAIPAEGGAFPTPTGSATDFVRINNMTVSTFYSDFRVSPNILGSPSACNFLVLACINAGHYYVDTDSKPLTGAIQAKVSSGILALDIVQTFTTGSNPAFFANDWFTKWRYNGAGLTGSNRVRYNGPGVVLPTPCANASFGINGNGIGVFQC